MNSIDRFKEKIASELRWEKVEEIPDFPCSSFSQVKQQIETNIFTVGIDYTTANQLSQWLYGKGFSFLFLMLAATPVFVALLAVILAIALSNYWLLTGVILGVVGHLMANPYNPSKNFWKPIVGTLFLAFIYGLWQGKETLTYLSGFFVFSFFVNNFLYEMSKGKLKRLALETEIIFIYLYQEGKLGLKHNESGESFWVD